MKKREIVLDTETTGLNTTTDRVVEIGCVELLDGIPSGRTFQRYVNPQRSVPYSAILVHGLDDKRLAGAPVFAQVADAFLEFVGDAPLVIHNAQFDIGMLNAELRACGRPLLDKARSVDTLLLARQKRPGAPANLDALCKHYGVRADRKRHGALKDALALADVYVHLNGGRQCALDVAASAAVRVRDGIRPSEWTPRLVQPTEAEFAAHRAFVATIPNAIWRMV